MPIPKGSKQSEPHRLKVRIAHRKRMIKQLDENYVRRREQLDAELKQAEADLMRAEVLAKAAKVESVA